MGKTFEKFVRNRQMIFKYESHSCIFIRIKWLKNCKIISNLYSSTVKWELKSQYVSLKAERIRLRDFREIYIWKAECCWKNYQRYEEKFHCANKRASDGNEIVEEDRDRKRATSANGRIGSRTGRLMQWSEPNRDEPRDSGITIYRVQNIQNFDGKGRDWRERSFSRNKSQAYCFTASEEILTRIFRRDY